MIQFDNTLHEAILVKEVLSRVLVKKLFIYYAINLFSFIGFSYLIYLFETIPLRFSMIYVYVAITWLIRYYLVQLVLGKAFVQFFIPKENILRLILIITFFMSFSTLLNISWIMGGVGTFMLTIGLYYGYRVLSIYDGTSTKYIRPVSMTTKHDLTNSDLNEILGEKKVFFVLEYLNGKVLFGEIYVFKDNRGGRLTFPFSRASDPGIDTKNPTILYLEKMKFIKSNFNSIDKDNFVRGRDYISVSDNGKEPNHFIQLFEILTPDELISMSFVWDKWTRRAKDSKFIW